MTRTSPSTTKFGMIVLLNRIEKLFRPNAVSWNDLGGDMASTWIAKPEVHAEVQISS